MDKRVGVRAALAMGLILACGCLWGQDAPRDHAGIAQRRLEHLRHGINLTGWFAQVYDGKGYTKEHLQTYVTIADLALIRQMGFDHVRLSVDPQPMFQAGHADEIPAEYLGYLDAAVNTILDQGLGVILDIQPESDFKARLAQDDFVEQFADFWRALARHYSRLDPQRVFLEILNEPEMRDRYRWMGVQAKLAAAIREGAPEHTIIASGARYAADDELVFLQPLPDPNVIYNFHFYEPHVFTHQGATWGVNYWHYLDELEYPSNRESAEKAAAEVPDEVNRLNVLRYGMEHWDANRIEMEIGRAAAWASRYEVPVLCDEFGAYRRNTRAKDRAAWIRDVRAALERHGIGWTMWEYAGGFGVVTEQQGRKAPDEMTLGSLGLGGARNLR